MTDVEFMVALLVALLVVAAIVARWLDRRDAKKEMARRAIERLNSTTEA